MSQSFNVSSNKNNTFKISSNVDIDYLGTFTIDNVDYKLLLTIEESLNNRFHRVERHKYSSPNRPVCTINRKSYSTIIFQLYNDYVKFYDIELNDLSAYIQYSAFKDIMLDVNKFLLKEKIELFLV